MYVCIHVQKQGDLQRYHVEIDQLHRDLDAAQMESEKLRSAFSALHDNSEYTHAREHVERLQVRCHTLVQADNTHEGTGVMVSRGKGWGDRQRAHVGEKGNVFVDDDAMQGELRM